MKTERRKQNENYTCKQCWVKTSGHLRCSPKADTLIRHYLQTSRQETMLNNKFLKLIITNLTRYMTLRTYVSVINDRCIPDVDIDCHFDKLAAIFICRAKRTRWNLKLTGKTKSVVYAVCVLSFHLCSRESLTIYVQLTKKTGYLRPNKTDHILMAPLKKGKTGTLL